MSNIVLTVTDFTFPADLPDKYAAFRLQVYLRYADTDGNLKEVMEVTPGAGENDYWECEKKNKKKPNFVRHPTLPRIDTTKVDVASRAVLFAGLKFASLDRVTVKIYDVEKDSKFDNLVRDGLKLAFPVAVNLLSGGTAITVGNILTELKKKSGKDEDRSDVEKKVNEVIDSTKKAGKTRLIWTHSADIEGITSGDPFAVTGNSQPGIFTVDFMSKIK